MTSRQIHDAQVRMVKASVLMATSRTERHAITSRAGTKPCGGCGEPKSFLWCSRCLIGGRS